jgi:hypothetical protein
MLAFAGALYLAPVWIALGRRHPRRWAIVLLTLATGWTGVGWIAALVWAVSYAEDRGECPGCDAPFRGRPPQCPGCGMPFTWRGL